MQSSFRISEEEFAAELESGDSISFDLNIRNDYNGLLEWIGDTKIRGESGAEPWSLRQSLNASEIADESRVKGAILVDDSYYVTGGGRSSPDDNYVYKISRDSELTDQYRQFNPESRYGMSDLTWDGELIWGGDEDSIYGFTPEGEVMTRFSGPFDDNRALAWDSERNILWISDRFSRYIAGYREVEEVVRLPGYDLTIYGLAFYPNDPDGYPLYIYHNVDIQDAPDRAVVHKVNPDTEDTLFVAELTDEQGSVPEGIFITDNFDPLCWTMLAIVNNGLEDRLDIWQLHGKTSWMSIEPNSGSILPEEQQELTLMLEATDLIPMEYPGELKFTHNGIGRETFVPVDLTVVNPNPIQPEDSGLPLEFDISTVYPNPFNSMTSINYELPIQSNVTLNVHDITGRIVESLINSNKTAGRHTVTWKANRYTSGLYFIKMNAGDYTTTQKVMLIK